MTKTDKRILNEKLLLLLADAERQYNFCMCNPQWFKTGKVVSHNIARYNKLSRAIHILLTEIDYKNSQLKLF